MNSPVSTRSDSLGKLGPYELVERLASGGMAEVYVARRAGAWGFSKTVALKRILPQHTNDGSFVAMFVDEARVTASLSHPNLVQVFDFGEDNGELFMAMELVEGTTCAKLVRASSARSEVTPVEISLFIILSVLRGLDHAHHATDENGVVLNLVHRDVSPGNVLLSHSGTVKLGDFGIMRACGIERRTEHGQLKGKLGYMSPEQVSGREVDARSDLFTVGIVLAELLIGRPLFSHGQDLDILLRIRDADTSIFTKYGHRLPDELRAVVIKALARNPADRFASAAHFAEALEDFARRRRLVPGAPRLAAYLERLGLAPLTTRSGEHAIVMPGVMPGVAPGSAAPRSSLSAPSSLSSSSPSSPAPGSQASTSGVATSPLSTPSAPSTPTLSAPPSHGSHGQTAAPRASASLASSAGSAPSVSTSGGGRSSTSGRSGSPGQPGVLGQPGQPGQPGLPSTSGLPGPSSDALGAGAGAMHGPGGVNASHGTRGSTGMGAHGGQEAPLPSTKGHGAGSFRVQLADGSISAALPLPRVLELLITGLISANSPVSRDGAPFALAIDHPELKRIASASTHRWEVFEDVVGERCPAGPLTTAPFFLDLAARRATGLVQGQSNGHRRKIYLIDGLLEFASSNAPEDLLGRRLIDEGLCLPVELDMALALAPKYGGKLGDALVGLGVLRPLELFRALDRQLRARMCSIFSWPTGMLTFVKDARCHDEILPAPIPYVDLVARGLTDALSQVEMRALLQPLHDEPLIPEPRPALTALSLRMTENESATLAAIDGRCALDDLLRELPRRGIARESEIVRAVLLGLSARMIRSRLWADRGSWAR